MSIRVEALHACVERQIEARKRLYRDLAELDDAMRVTLAEYMDLVTESSGARRALETLSPAASAGEGEGEGEEQVYSDDTRREK